MMTWQTLTISSDRINQIDTDARVVQALAEGWEPYSVSVVASMWYMHLRRSVDPTTSVEKKTNKKEKNK